MADDLEMNGESALIIGRGRAGKTGFAIKYITKQRPARWFIIAPRITNPLLKNYAFIENPESAEEIADAFNDNDADPLVILLTEPRLKKGKPSIWKMMTDPYFRDFYIMADELAVLNSESEVEKDFDSFIRLVGQNNQHFFGLSHRIKDDVNPVVPLNVEKIWFVGRLADEEEARKLYSLSSLRDEMTFDDFTKKLKSQPKKFEWWSEHMNWEAAWLIYS